MKLAQDFRRRAKQSLRGNWFVAIIAGIIASLLGGMTTYTSTPSFSFSSSSGGDVGGSGGDVGGTGGAVGGEVIPPDVLATLIGIFSIIAIVAVVFSLIYLIIGGAVGVGYSKFNLDLHDHSDASVGTLFEYFSEWKKPFWGRILQSIYISLWTLLFFFPGIMAAYSYSMMHYVMADNPEMTANQAIRESKRIMKGNRWRFFCLEMSFIGWWILCICTLGLASIWVVPYQQASFAAFYREVSGTDKTEEDPKAEYYV